MTTQLLRRFTAVLSMLIVLFCACKAQAQAAHTQAARAQSTPPPTPITHLNSPQGGMIMYGTVDGAATQPAAMSKILHIVHENCGDKPQIGKVFQFKGTHTVGVFFTVTNHPQGNTPVAGLVISAASGPHQVEAALVSDRASRFGQSVNPMLQQLFAVWHPGGQAAASSAAFGGKSAPPGGGNSSAGPAQLHMVTLPDNSASVGVPNGWKINGGGGTMNFTGPHMEIFLLNVCFNALDPRDPTVRQGIAMRRQYGDGPPDTNVYLPYGVNVPQAFVTFFQDSQRRGNIPPTSFQFSNTSQIPGQPCARLEGTTTSSADAENYEFSGVFCEHQSQGGSGIWEANLYMALLPKSVAVQEHATGQAIMASFQMNQAVANAIAAPAIGAIHAIGARADAQMKSAEAAHDIQNNAERARQNSYTTHYSNTNDSQDNQARINQDVANYLLDQTVVQDNNMYGNGTVGHGTVDNSTADALIKADPNRYESVDTSNYWKGTDF